MKEMTSLERVRAVLNGELPDRVPVIPQGFMFCAANCGYHIGQINRDPKKMAETQIRTQEQFGYDGCVIDVDDATLAEACGARALFRDNGVAIVDEEHPAIEDLREIDTLKLPDPKSSGRLPEWLETTQRIMDAIGDHVFVMGRADQGPFDLLCLLRGAQDFMMDLIMHWSGRPRRISSLPMRCLRFLTVRAWVIRMRGRIWSPRLPM
jgi:uroporphyrinogen-III decarboxylase